MFGPFTYLILEVGWALPILALQWVVGLPELWHARRAWILATLIPTIYLSAADRLALGNGIWTIHADRSTGILLGGLPIEEALFFLLTNLMVVQALILFQSPVTLARLRRWAGRLTHRSMQHRGGVSSFAFGGTSASRATRGKITAVLSRGYRAGVIGAAVGGLLSTIVAAVFATDSVLEPLAQAVMQWTPIPIANVLMESLGPAARPLALLGALALLLVIGGLHGIATSAVAISLAEREHGREPYRTWTMGAVAGALALVLTFYLTSSHVGALAFGVGHGAVLWYAGRRWAISPEKDVYSFLPMTRRRALGETAIVVGSAGSVAGISVIDALWRDQLTPLAGQPVFPFIPPAPRRVGFPVDGLSSEVTPVPQFYVVSKNAQDPFVDVHRWRLQVGGLVQRPFRLSFEELRGIPRIDQYVTFQCVSNPVGGSLMSNAYWSGASLKALLERAGPLPTAGRVVFRAPDGHEESLPLDLALREENLIAYAMNGELLTRLHGHPVRALLPGHYGFKQVKWLTQIDLAPEDHRGYWPRRGWTDLAEIRTTARIDLARIEGDHVRVAGIALAGRRSISSVAVRILGGERRQVTDWLPAELHLPALSHLTWVQWRTLIPTPAGEAILWAEARAVDGQGNPQETALSGPFPNGASGLHRLQVRA